MFGMSPSADKPPSIHTRIAQTPQNLKEDRGLNCSESSRTQSTILSQFTY